MASHREQVILALVALLDGRLTGVEVKRNAPWPDRSEASGMVIVRDGDPGEPERVLSPAVYTYRHEIPVEVFGPQSEEERHALLDALLVQIGEAIESDRSLSGLCEWLEVSAAAPDDVAAANANPIRAAILTVTAEYTTSNPLA